MQYDESYRDSGQVTFSSIVLLVIFVSAAALILAAVIWRPWFDDDDSTVQAPSAAEQAPGEVAAEGQSVDGEALPVEAVAGP